MSGTRHPSIPHRLVALLLGAILAVAGCSDDDDGPTMPQPEPSFVRVIDDLNYVHGKYYFLQRPGEQLATNSRIDFSTVRLFIDDHDGSNNQGTLEALGAVDPTAVPVGPDTLAGFFDGMRQLDDYQVTTSYFGERFPVVVLSNPISSSLTLAVTYEEILPGGSRRSVGFVPEGGDPRALLKLLQVPRQILKAKVGAPDYFETDPEIDPFVPTRDLELKGFYDLQSTNIDPESITIQVRRYDAAVGAVTHSYSESAVLFPYLQITGIDLFTDNGSGAAAEGPDGTVDRFTDAWFLDTEAGVLHFPDLRPFDPRVTPRPDARPEEDVFFKTRLPADLSIPGLRERILWPAGASDPPGVAGGGITPEDLESNPRPYDKRNIQLVDDRRYYLRVAFYL